MCEHAFKINECKNMLQNKTEHRKNKQKYNEKENMK